MGLSHGLAYDQGSSDPNVTAIAAICIPAKQRSGWNERTSSLTNCTRRDKAQQSSIRHGPSATVVAWTSKSKKIARFKKSKAKEHGNRYLHGNDIFCYWCDANLFHYQSGNLSSPQRCVLHAAIFSTLFLSAYLTNLLKAIDMLNGKRRQKINKNKLKVKRHDNQTSLVLIEETENKFGT